MITRTRWLGLLFAVAAALALLPGAAFALPINPPKIGLVCLNGPSFNLVATGGAIQTPDGNSVYMWSYADSSGQFQYPGPVLCVTQGQSVSVTLTNNLPEASSIVFPGQEGVGASGGSAGLFTKEAAANGGTVTYTFTASQPGTYLYESGSNVAKQVEMGLYGALVVRPSAGANYAYDATTQFDPTREYMLLLADIDPDLHHAVETGGTYDFTALHDRYFTINGRSFPDTIQDNANALLPAQPYGALLRLQPTSPSNQPALIRMLNAGPLNHPFHPHGNHTREIAQDGRLLTAPGGGSASTEHFGETIGAGQTEDYLVRWDTQGADSAGTAFNDYWNPTTNQLPVPQPNYQNLTFKDGNTWYSGSPYLGYKGTLPTGTVSQNVCGEWYFPLHSHALNEFTNYDQGFGGMGTLLRVDPQGGCFSFPSSSKITVGTLNSGSISALAADDANYYRINSTTSGTRTTDWYAQFSGVAAGSADLSVTYKGRNCGTGAGTCPSTTAQPTTLFVWNWSTSAWVQLGSATNIGTTDVTVTRTIANPAANFIGTGANKGFVRIRVLTTGGTTNFVTGANLFKLVYTAP